MKRWLLLLLFSLPIACFTQTNTDIVIGKTDFIYSKILKENRTFFIRLPRNYNNPSFSPDKYPVLILLDGEAHFNSVCGLVEILGSGINGTHVTPDMFVIGIPNTDRTRDLTPTHDSKDFTGRERDDLENSGGNNNFLHFIKDELLPHIDSLYRTMPYRVLVGHSLGGIAVINALYTMPETFNAYIAIDPSLWWDHQVLLKKAETYFKQNDLPNKWLYLGQANTLIHDGDSSLNTHFESIKMFSTLLQTRNYSGINWKYDYYSDDDHGSVPFISEYAGLRFIFDGYHIRPGDVISNPAKLKEQFKTFSVKTNVIFSPPEDVINSLGYNLMAINKIDQAIEYFQMNIDNYPKSSNVYDSMGEAQMKKGDTRKAIEYYQKSLQLNPNNDNARKNIAKMQEKK